MPADIVRWSYTGTLHASGNAQRQPFELGLVTSVTSSPRSGFRAGFAPCVQSRHPALQPIFAAAHSSGVKAAVRASYGPPEVVRVVEAQKPAIKDNELLVRVHATTVNRTDCAARAADPFIWRLFAGLVRPKLAILGNEFAGEVEAIGGGVKSFKIGDKVFGYSGSRFGAHAEYMSIPEDGTLAIIPAGLTYVEAAPSTEGSHYALAMIRKTKIGAGQNVLVYGATGAIGSAAVQLSKNVGAGVTAVCGTQHIELVKGLGADRVIDYMVEDFTKDDQKYDVVIDAVGKSTFDTMQATAETPRDLCLFGRRTPLGERDVRAHHATARWQEGRVSDPEG